MSRLVLDINKHICLSDIPSLFDSQSGSFLISPSFIAESQFEIWCTNIRNWESALVTKPTGWFLDQSLFSEELTSFFSTNAAKKTAGDRCQESKLAWQNNSFPLSLLHWCQPPISWLAHRQQQLKSIPTTNCFVIQHTALIACTWSRLPSCRHLVRHWAELMSSGLRFKPS